MKSEMLSKLRVLLEDLKRVENFEGGFLVLLVPFCLHVSWTVCSTKWRIYC